jgi:hypothetical protein
MSADSASSQSYSLWSCSTSWQARKTLDELGPSTFERRVIDRQSQSRPLDTKASTFTALYIRTGGSARSTRSPRTRWPPARSPVSSACGERARYALSEIVRYPARALNAAVDVMADAEGEIGRICTTSDYLHSGTRSRSHRSRQRSSGRSSPLAWPSPMARARQVRGRADKQDAVSGGASDAVFAHSNNRQASKFWEPNWEPTAPVFRQHRAMVCDHQCS